MKVLNYIACFLLPLAVINNNDTMARKPQVLRSNQNYNSSVGGVMKFYNYSGGNMCSLTSLNQCLSALNPGNNEILKQFVQKYNSIANNKNINSKSFAPQYILRDVLHYIPNSNNKEILLYDDGEDIIFRYQSLISISEMLGADISTVNNYTVMSQGDEIQPVANTLREEIIRQNKDLQKCGQPGANYNNVMNLVLQFDSMNGFNLFKDDVIKANNIVIDNNCFSLSSVAFRTISGRDAKLENSMSQGDQRPYFANNSYTHFISAKKLANGKWALINSSIPDNIRTYNSFELLMNSLGNRYLPRMVLFSKTQNNDINEDNNRLRNTNKNKKTKLNKGENADINVDKYDISETKKQTSNTNRYDVNNAKKNKPTNNMKNNDINKIIETRINKLRLDIEKKNTVECDNVNLLKACLKGNKQDVRQSIADINGLYHNKEMRNLIMKNSDSNDIYDFLCKFNCGYLYNYKDLISDIFNKHARLKDLNKELSEINKLRADMEDLRKQRDDSVELLKSCLKENKRDVRQSINDINEVYHNKEMRNLIMKDSNSNKIDKFFNDFGYEHLNDYKEIISDIFNKKARLKELETEVSKMKN